MQTTAVVYREVGTFIIGGKRNVYMNRKEWYLGEKDDIDKNRIRIHDLNRLDIVAISSLATNHISHHSS